LLDLGLGSIGFWQNLRMSNRLDRFNTLPPKPLHSKKVRAFLACGIEFNISEIVGGTGLTKTQVLCALDPMVRTGEVNKGKNTMRFWLNTLKGDDDFARLKLTAEDSLESPKLP
jgi:hypothetical protein